MITGQQLRAARALLRMDQRSLAAACGLSLPTIQRMESSDGVVRGNVESLTKLIETLKEAYETRLKKKFAADEEKMRRILAAETSESPLLILRTLRELDDGER